MRKNYTSLNDARQLASSHCERLDSQFYNYDRAVKILGQYLWDMDILPSDLSEEGFWAIMSEAELPNEPPCECLRRDCYECGPKYYSMTEGEVTVTIAKASGIWRQA